MSEGSGAYYEPADNIVTSPIREFKAISLLPEKIYNFKVQSENAFGYSVLSAAKSILCATKPSKLSLAPTTSVTTNMVTIDWSTPTLNGLPI